MPTTINGLTGVDNVQDNTITSAYIQDGAITGDKLNRFTSADQTITAGGDLTIPHGLGAVPFHVTTLLKCVTANQGYSAGDLIVMNFIQQSSSGADTYGATIRVDATNIYIYYGNQSNTIIANNPTTNALVELTNASWRLVVKAEL